MSDKLTFEQAVERAANMGVEEEKLRLRFAMWHGYKTICTCDTCDIAAKCKSAFDTYNNDGDCLEGK